MVGWVRPKAGVPFGFKRDANGVLEAPIADPENLSGTYATGINNFGEITGWYEISTSGLSETFGFELTGGVRGTYMTIDLSHDYPYSTVINGLNNLGDFVGTRTGPPSGAFASIAGIVTSVQFPGAFETTANGIGWDDSIVGCANRGAFAFVRGPHENFLKLEVAGAQKTCALGINEAAGKIVGYYQDAVGGTGAPYHGFIYNYASDLRFTSQLSAAAVRSIPVQAIDYPGAIGTRVTGINSKGTIVGWAEMADGFVVSFTGTPLP